MFKIKPRCKECGRRLKDGKCVNPKCVAVYMEKKLQEKPKE